MEPKNSFFSGACCALVLSAGLLYLSGCASTSHDKASTANSDLQKAAMRINTESHAIDVTMATLDDLVNRPAPDLKPQFSRFSSALDRLIASAASAEKAADRASESSTIYFQSWDKDAATINYEAVRDQSLSRKTQVSSEFNTVNQRYRENQAVVGPLISYLQDIRTALGADLTAGGIESVRPLAQNAGQNAQKVQTALARLAGDYSSSGIRLSSALPQQTQPQGGVADPINSSQRADSSH